MAHPRQLVWAVFDDPGKRAGTGRGKETGRESLRIFFFVDKKEAKKTSFIQCGTGGGTHT